MGLYHEPSSAYARPSLVGDLLGVPATASQHQLENQATTVVAWLVDRSPTLAEVIVRLFLADHTPRAGQVGARTQLSLPKPGGGALYPDLSICMADRALQLEIYPDVVDGLENEGGVPSRLIKTDAGVGRQEGTPWWMFAGSPSGRTTKGTWSRWMISRARVLAG